MAIYYPPVGFHFVVRFEGLLAKPPTGIPDISFQKVSGLSSEVGVFTYKEGGENRFEHRMPDPVKYSNLVLTRGMLVGSQAIGKFRDAVESFKFQKSVGEITVILLNSSHLPIQAWNFYQAWPVKWSFSDLDAESNTVFIENIEFAYQYFRRIDATNVVMAV